MASSLGKCHEGPILGLVAPLSAISSTILIAEKDTNVLSDGFFRQYVARSTEYSSKVLRVHLFYNDSRSDFSVFSFANSLDAYIASKGSRTLTSLRRSFLGANDLCNLGVEHNPLLPTHRSFVLCLFLDGN